MAAFLLQWADDFSPRRRVPFDASDLYEALQHLTDYDMVKNLLENTLTHISIVNAI